MLSYASPIVTYASHMLATPPRLLATPHPSNKYFVFVWFLSKYIPFTCYKLTKEFSTEYKFATGIFKNRFQRPRPYFTSKCFGTSLQNCTVALKNPSFHFVFRTCSCIGIWLQWQRRPWKGHSVVNWPKIRLLILIFLFVYNNFSAAKISTCRFFKIKLYYVFICYITL
jgi:hypothetical protein